MYLAYNSSNVGIWSYFVRASSAVYPTSGSISSIVNNHDVVVPSHSSAPAHPQQ
jgi:hypothetical protein